MKLIYTILASIYKNSVAIKLNWTEKYRIIIAALMKLNISEKLATILTNTEIGFYETEFDKAE